MYYNIKIKSNGSEFSLETTNKEITQREMDMYFAQIFDVSQEFKSKIKKVEINNSNVKSINELENYQKNTHLPTKAPSVTPSIKIHEIPTQATEKPTETIEIKTTTPKPIQEVKSEIKMVSLNPEVANRLETKENLAQSKVENLQQINLQNFAQPIIQNGSLPSQVLIKENIEEQLTPQIQTNFEASEPTLNEIENLLTEAIEIELQETLEVTPTILSQESTPSPLIQESTPEFTNEYSTQVVQDFTQPQEEITYTYTAQTFEQNDITEKQEESEAPIPQSEIDELIAIAQSKLNALNINSNTNLTTQPTTISKENVDLTYDTIDLDLSKSKFANKQNFTQSLAQEKEKYQSGNLESKNNYYNYDRQEQLNNIFSEEKEEEKIEPNVPTIENITLETPVVELPTINLVEAQTRQPIEQTQTSYTTDFKLYLNDFKCENQTDKFLVCAYYIKNILKEQNFSMKSINSKLFQATGMIANLEVLDDLISKEYIRAIDTEDSKKYCITPDGESYFINRFQG